MTELITVVNVALGEAAVESCHRTDLDRDDGIQVDEILQGVNSALGGCDRT